MKLYHLMCRRMGR